MELSEIYEKAICYANGDSNEKYSKDEKEFLIQSIINIIKNNTLNKEEELKIDVISTIFCIYGDQNDFHLKKLKRIAEIFMEVERDYYSQND